MPQSVVAITMLLICFFCNFSNCLSQNLNQLKVSDNGRFLAYANGTPFFYLGDTAWELFHRLDREEADHYLSDRAEKGFTVIQAVILAQLGGLNDPNANGDKPLFDNNPEKPNVAYFEHVDHIVGKAASLGLFVGLLPSWGDKWKKGESDESGIFTVENAYSFGQFLGNRYKNQPIIWILGGDQNIKNEEEAAIIESMAKGLIAGDGGTHLVTYHPRGPGLSSDYFHNADWLDFNMFQSSHAARDHDNGLFTSHDFALEPVKPTLDGEPRYETIPVGFYYTNVDRNDRFDDYDARQAAYWSLLAGACGHTYGNNNIWQMWAPGRTPVIGANIPWHKALNHPGAFQMGHIRRLFESRPFQQLVPDQSILVDAPQNGGGKVKAALARDGSFSFIYTPRGEPFSVDMGAIKAESVKAFWFDPRYGSTAPIYTGDNVGIQTFTPPSHGRGNDWVLVLEDASANWSEPGQ